MTPEINRSKVEIDHVKTISSFVISKDEGMREAFTCNKTQSILKAVHHYKGTDFDFFKEILQFRKGHQILKTNENGRNKDFRR